VREALANARWEVAAAIACLLALAAAFVAWRRRRGRSGIQAEFGAYADALGAS
jgi:hypothetical protein